MSIVISPVYEVLIYLEHYGKTDLSSLNRQWGRNTARGSLGKMEAMGLIYANQEGDSKVIRLSRKGYFFLNSILDAIHRGVLHWDGKWLFVWFCLPETARSKRDKFRRALESLGFRPILKSAWVTPLDKSKQVEEAANKTGIGDSYIMVESTGTKGWKSEKIIGIWDFNKTRDHYERFISSSQKIMAGGAQASPLEIKKKIFEYALILNGEPQVPIELFPQDWPKFRATLQYKKLKRLIS